MATWTAFHPWIKPLVPGCPDPMIDRAVCDAAIEFCEMTQAFVERGAFATRVGRSVYEVVSEEGSPGMVLGVTLADRSLSPVYIDALVNAYGERWKDHTGQPQFYLADSEDTLRVYPTPDRIESGHITLAVRPERGATAWDDRLYERYAETIAEGALARLLNQYATPWAEPSAAMQRRQRFQQGINKVRAKVNSAYTPASPFAYANL